MPDAVGVLWTPATQTKKVEMENSREGTPEIVKRFGSDGFGLVWFGLGVLFVVFGLVCFQFFWFFFF